jgi:hypothetical protein
VAQLNPEVNQKLHKYAQYSLYWEEFLVQTVPPSTVFESKMAHLMMDLLMDD